MVLARSVAKSLMAPKISKEAMVVTWLLKIEQVQARYPLFLIPHVVDSLEMDHHHLQRHVKTPALEQQVTCLVLIPTTILYMLALHHDDQDLTPIRII